MVTVMSSRKILLLALSLSLAYVAALPQDASAAKRRSGGGGGRPGGVILQTPNPTNPVEHNNRGVELGGKGLWNDAIREHELAVEGDPYDTRWRTNLSAAHLEYGKHLAARGQKYPAAAQFRRAMFVDPANAAADSELDKVLASLKQDPSSYQYRKSLASDADVAGQYDTSIVEWRKCVKMRDDPLSHAELGRVLLKAGKQVEGYKELRIAVGRSDWGADQRNELATTHRQLAEILKEFALKAKEAGKGSKGMQRLSNAGVEYRRAITLNPADGATIAGLIEVAQMAVAIKPSFDNHLLLGGAYLLAGKFPQAQNEYKECYKLGPTRSELSAARIAYHQAVARSPLASPEQVAESVATVKKLIDDSSEDARLWYILGRLREHQVDYEKAKKCYEKAISINPLIDPDLKGALVRIGAAPAESEKAPVQTAKNVEQSKEALKKAMQEKAYTDIEAQIESGDHQGAIDKAQELFAKDPKDGRLATLMGRAYEKKGDADMAKGFYRTASALGDSSASRFVNQIDSVRLQPKVEEGKKLMAEGKYLDASSVFRDALIINPERADVHRYLSECLQKIGDKKAAREESDEADRIDRGETPKPKSIISEDKPSGESAAPEAKKVTKKAEKKVEEKKAEAEEGMSAAGMGMAAVKSKNK